MAISGATINKGGTYSAPTGGSDKTLVSLGGQLGFRQVYFDGQTPLARSEAVFTTKAAKPKADAPNGYTQPRRKMLLKFPKLLANGLTTYATVSVEMAVDVECTAADIATYLLYTADATNKASFGPFWSSGSTD